MQASDRSLIEILSIQAHRFSIPIFQRPYAWRQKNCERLLKDILAIAERAGTAKHFFGSIVWVNTETSPTGVTTFPVIDGQQRLTTTTLLLAALAKYARAHDNKAPNGQPLGYYAEMLLENGGHLINIFQKHSEAFYKLTLTSTDNLTYRSIIDHVLDPEVPIDRSGNPSMAENFDYFCRKLEELDNPGLVWQGLNQLSVVYVRLDPPSDNPQLVFECMNSTGLALSDADKIRNYILMGLTQDEQVRLYQKYWLKIEEALEIKKQPERFDDFFFCYLTLRKAPTVVKQSEIYDEFKRLDTKAEETLAELVALVKYYQCVTKPDTLTRLGELYDHIVNRLKMGVAVPFVVGVSQLVTEAGFHKQELIEVLEAFLNFNVRRYICRYRTQSFNTFLPSLYAQLRTLVLKKEKLAGFSIVTAFTALLNDQKSASRRCPTDEQFETFLKDEELFGNRVAKYVLERIEETYHTKNRLDYSNLTIEHIMPQTLTPEWKIQLGNDSDKVHNLWLHVLGNLTLTGYNSEMSNLSFEEKKLRIFDENQEVIGMSQSLRDLDHWGEDEIMDRTLELTEKAMAVFAMPAVNREEQRKYLRLLRHASVTVNFINEDWVMPHDLDSARFYRVMPGKKSKYFEACLSGNMIGCDCDIDDDLTDYLPEDWHEFNEAYISKYLERNPNKTKTAAGLACGQLWTVSKGIKVGDIVLMPNERRQYACGQVMSDYRYVPDARGLQHQRVVQWCPVLLEKDDLSTDLQNSIGSLLTVVDVSKYADELIELVKDASQQAKTI